MHIGYQQDMNLQLKRLWPKKNKEISWSQGEYLSQEKMIRFDQVLLHLAARWSQRQHINNILHIYVIKKSDIKQNDLYVRLLFCILTYCTSQSAWHLSFHLEDILIHGVCLSSECLKYLWLFTVRETCVSALTMQRQLHCLWYWK